MRESRPELFRGRHFRDEVIVLCVRWYLRYPLSYRNLEEMMAERGLSVDHSRKWPPLSRPFFRRNKLRIGESDFEIRGDRSRPRHSGA